MLDTATIGPGLFWGELNNQLGWHRPKLDAVRMMQLCGHQPDDWQHRTLTTTDRNILAVCSRQVGKTTTSVFWTLEEALRDLEQALNVVVGSPSFFQSARVLARVRINYRRLRKTEDGRHLPEIINRDPSIIRFENESTIIALPANPDTIVGETAHAILIEEASKTRKHVVDVLTPMGAATNARMLKIATAGYTGHWLHDEWSDTANPSTTRVTVKWSDCPRIHPEFIEREKRRMTARMFAREYEAVWAAGDGAAFDPDAVKAAFTSVPAFDVPPIEEMMVA